MRRNARRRHPACRSPNKSSDCSNDVRSGLQDVHHPDFLQAVGPRPHRRARRHSGDRLSRQRHRLSDRRRRSRPAPSRRCIAIPKWPTPAAISRPGFSSCAPRRPISSRIRPTPRCKNFDDGQAMAMTCLDRIQASLAAADQDSVTPLRITVRDLKASFDSLVNEQKSLGYRRNRGRHRRSDRREQRGRKHHP